MFRRWSSKGASWRRHVSRCIFRANVRDIISSLIRLLSLRRRTIKELARTTLVSSAYRWRKSCASSSTRHWLRRREMSAAGMTILIPFE